MRLVIEQLSKSFKNVQAVQPSDLTVAQGEFLSLLGPSGCGKTTLLRMIAGLEDGEGGKIWMDNTLLFDAKQRLSVPPEKRGLGMVFQDFALWPHLTVFENVAFPLRAKGLKKELKEKVNWALSKVRLVGFEQRYPHQLSGGQQQRVAIARAIVTLPKLILLDEPLSALDANLREELRFELTQLVKELGFTAIYVTHDQTEAMCMSDRICIMEKGQILQIDSPENLYRRPTNPFVARFVGKSNWLPKQPSQLIRPENVHLQPHAPDDVQLSGVVHQVGYQGDRYEIGVEVEDQHWIVYSPERLAHGSVINLYIANKSIFHFKGEEDLNEKVDVIDHCIEYA